jgi:hypothetical protein
MEFQDFKYRLSSLWAEGFDRETIVTILCKEFGDIHQRLAERMLDELEALDGEG